MTTPSPPSSNSPGNQGQKRARRLPWPAIIVTVFVLIFSQTTFWQRIELQVFDVLNVINAPGQNDLPITIIGIDEPSLAEMKRQYPWPRRYYAQLLDKLKEAGAAVVAFDIVFGEPSNDKEDDRLFAEAIQRFENVVLAANVNYSENRVARQWLRVDPIAPFLHAGAISGLASVELDIDTVQRKIPTMSDALWRQTLTLFSRQFPEYLGEVPVAQHDMRISYLGGPHTFTYIPFYKMLDPDRYLPDYWRDTLKDNIILVGRDLNATAVIDAAAGDMFQSPFFAIEHELMPGVEVHANIITNMLQGNFLSEAPRWASLILLILTAIAATLSMQHWRPWRSAVIGLVLIASIGLIDLLLFFEFRLWLPATATSLAVGLIYIAQGGVAFFIEKQQQRQIREAFSMYVAPTVVDEMLANPEKLKLGGERRELTILFTDLSGFTTFSESLAPEKTAAILNRHLHEMTEIVLKHKGTVDKFIGDSVMAFWGAPIADEDQALHATQAALEMKKSLRIMNDELVQQNGIRLKMRIGIHRGDCIVGNMGGETRFDYTAIGDSVNLASRLEGANKFYGTGILLSDTVAGKIESTITLRRIDTIRVKGKTLAVSIYTPETNQALIEASHLALQAWSRGEWDSAMQQWEAILLANPEDPIARIFIMRLVQFSENGWPRNWDGITTLDNK